MQGTDLAIIASTKFHSKDRPGYKGSNGLCMKIKASAPPSMRLYQRLLPHLQVKSPIVTANGGFC
jgi:hypothetical protein